MASMFLLIFISLSTLGSICKATTPAPEASVDPSVVTGTTVMTVTPLGTTTVPTEVNGTTAAPSVVNGTTATAPTPIEGNTTTAAPTTPGIILLPY